MQYAIFHILAPEMKTGNGPFNFRSFIEVTLNNYLHISVENKIALEIRKSTMKLNCIIKCQAYPKKSFSDMACCRLGVTLRSE